MSKLFEQLGRITNPNQMHENYIEPYQGQFFEDHLGVNIDKEGKTYVAGVWSEKKNKYVELAYFDLDELKAELNEILAYNFHASLTYIADHFGATKDFNNPDQNLENTFVAIEKKFKEFIRN
jgi:hypothetical protein